MGFAGARQQTRQVIAGMPRRQQDAARTSNLPIMVRTVPEVRRSSYHRLPAGAEGLPPNRIARMDDWSLGRLCAVGKDGNVLKAAAHPRFMQAYAAGR